MSNNNFTANFTIQQTPMQAFDAINKVNQWWSEKVTEPTSSLHNEFIYRHEDQHYSRHLITGLIPGKKVVWQTTDSYTSFTENKTEWTGTTISFDISEHDGQTHLRFTHHGLTPQLECFEACTGGGGWGYYLPSLISLITTGKGTPDKLEETATNLS